MPCTVLIAAAEHLAALERRASAAGSEVLAFADVDALRALEAIVLRRPSLVALERQFAATPRGTALINRIKADPALDGSEIRVVSHNSDYTRVSPRHPALSDTGSINSVAGEATLTRGTSATAFPHGSTKLDQRGTRRAVRVRVNAPDLEIDGNPASLVDLSTIGAQVLSTTVLKPNQRVLISLAGDPAVAPFNASVAWASFEIPATGEGRYRAGLEFIGAPGDAIGAYCQRHRI